jgi:hypothetical protein
MMGLKELYELLGELINQPKLIACPRNQLRGLHYKINLTLAFWWCNFIFKSLKMKQEHFPIKKFISLNLMAQHKVNLDTLNIDQLNLYKHKAVTMRTAGMILTLGGVGIVVTSIIIENIPNDQDPDQTGDPAHDGISIWAIVFADMVGISCTIAGIPLWAIGGSRKAKAEFALKKFNIAPENSLAVGLGITLRF